MIMKEIENVLVHSNKLSKNKTRRTVFITKLHLV